MTGNDWQCLARAERAIQERQLGSGQDLAIGRAMACLNLSPINVANMTSDQRPQRQSSDRAWLIFGK